MYIDNGFIFAELSKAKLSFDDGKKNVKIHYEIREKQQTKIQNINLLNLDQTLKKNYNRSDDKQGRSTFKC